MGILEEFPWGLRMDGLESTPHLMDILFHPIYKCIQNHAVKGSFPQSGEIHDGFVLKPVCLLVDI